MPPQKSSDLVKERVQEGNRGTASFVQARERPNDVCEGSLALGPKATVLSRRGKGGAGGIYFWLFEV